METALTMPHARVARAWLLEAKYEFLRLLRTPSFALPTLLFPSLFYLLFGVLLNRGSGHGLDAASYLLVSYSVFGVMGPGLFGFGVSLGAERENGLLTLKRALPMPPLAYLLGKMAMAVLMAGIVMAPGLFGFGVVVAMEREQGLLLLKRALPMPPGAFLFAKMLMAMLFVTIVVTMLLALGFTLGHVRLPWTGLVALLGVDMLGVLPFCALGLFVGTLVGGQGAPAVINLIYLPMAFLSGLWIPLNLLPHLLQRLAPLWPANHLFLIALDASGLGGDHRIAWHALVLAGFTITFFALARRRLAKAG